ncbi:GNAT family N-acetyltransferase [Amphritea sp. HPY]|uniref:GNAT family N-acetyltransferase n=1 Tax=Amphritea sp. HPY TaxID=3421652 RepID=UPI003D7ED397
MFKFHFHNSVAEIGQPVWQSLAGTDYPFLRYQFLHALEASDSVCSSVGWQPLHMVVYSDDTAVALMPLYLKSHSYGEYVFDWAWADAYQRHGLDYYPKLVTAIPFTPAYGPRLCISELLGKQQQHELKRQLPQALLQLCDTTGASGWHGLFLKEDTLAPFLDAGFSPRLGTQYHWFNNHYQDFDQFLAEFNSRKRKNLRKERQKILQQGISHRFFSGTDISDQLLHEFYRFYQMTYLKRGRKGYLTLPFFDLIRQTMPDQMVLCVAYNGHTAVAAALSLRSCNTLYGRYWGCLEEYDSLHFETCYYQGIEYCIRHQLDRFDPGAQGEHKIQRGFRPIETWSVHWIREPGFREAIERFLDEEKTLVRQDIDSLTTLLPFRKN